MLSIVLILFVVFLVLGFPIAMAIGFTTFLPGLINPAFPADALYVMRSMVGGVDNTPILAIPLFMLSGIIMSRGGISERLFNVFAFLVGKRTAGIPMAVVITAVFYGAISGSGPATTAAVGAMTIPILVSLGYDRVFSAALVAAAGGIGIIIPPSIPFIMYGMMTGTSVGALFTAGFVPGILIAAMLMTYVYIYCKVKGEDKEKIAANYEKLRSKGFLGVMKEGFWALLTPVIILGGIYSGVVTPTEAAVLSVFYALLVSVFAYKIVKVREIPSFLDGAVQAYAPIALLLGFAIAFSRVLTLLKAPAILADYFSTSFTSGIMFLMLFNVIVLIIGMFMDAGPAVAILSPMLMGVLSQFGIDPVHFGIILVFNLAIGFISPPFGLNLFVASPMAHVSVSVLGKKALAFCGVYIVALILITYIPSISLVLGTLL